MLSKSEKFQEMIRNATRISKVFPGLDTQQHKPIVTQKSNLILPLAYPFRSSQQISSNTSFIHSVIHQISTQYMPLILHNQWPISCIGLVLCEHYQSNQKYYVYGTGTLIYANIVLTSAQNIYCRRLHTEYVNIKFVTGVRGNKCSGIYNVMRIYYPKEYTNWCEDHENYDFAVLQLYEDLSDNCGYVGWKTDYNLEDREIITYGYIINNKLGSFNLRQLVKYQKLEEHKEGSSGSGVLIKEGNQYYVVALLMLSRRKYNVLSKIIRNMVNEWTKITKLLIKNQDLSNSCDDIVKHIKGDLRQIYLNENKISAQGCRYLSQLNWTNLQQLYLWNNQIGAQGCKYLSQVNWKYLNTVNLAYNNISAQGCKYLSRGHWKCLIAINLASNNIDAQGCKYLSESYWIRQIYIDLRKNNINKISKIILTELWLDISFQ